MGQNNEPSNPKVLERAGSSRTASENTERLVRYLDSLGSEPATVRVREKLWALLACVLAAAYLESTDLSYQVMEKNSDLQRCEIYTKALTHVLNGGSLRVEGATDVSCKTKQIKERT
jgi:hypothetical protein